MWLPESSTRTVKQALTAQPSVIHARMKVKGKYGGNGDTQARLTLGAHRKSAYRAWMRPGRADLETIRVTDSRWGEGNG